MLRPQLLAMSSGIALVAALASTTPATAQTGEPAAAVEEVVVTGSRIAKRDLVADTPIVSVGRQQLQELGTQTVGDALNKLPQLSPSASQSNFGLTQINRGGITSVNLRGLGPSRNLVLVNGRRLQPSDAFGVIDINTIPDALVQNTEIITGGASAVYGSDALSGVVNLILQKRFEGIELTVDGGLTSRNDGGSIKTTFTAGANLDDNRGNVVLSLGYFDVNGICCQSSRPWFGPGATLGAARSPPLPPGRLLFGSVPSNLFSQAAIDSVFARYGIAAGRVPRTSVLNINSDGTLAFAGGGPLGPANLKPFADPIHGGNYDYVFQPLNTVDQLPYDTLNNSLPAGLVTWELTDVLALTIPVRRFTGFSQASYALTPNVEVYSQFSFTDQTAKYDFFLTQNGNAAAPTMMVPVDNPFIPADLRTLLASRPFPNAAFGWQTSNPQSPNLLKVHYTVFQGQLGARGALPVRDWTYDGYAAYGETRRSDLTTDLWDIATVEALLNGRNAAGLNDGGASQGCALNLFPIGPLSARCKQLILRDAEHDTRLKQFTSEFAIQGGLFDLPAGEVRFAAGLAYRRNTFDFIADSGLIPNPLLFDAIPALGGRDCPVAGVPSPGTGAYNFCLFRLGVTPLSGSLGGGTGPSSGRVSVKEGFVELSIPLLAGLPFVKSLTVNPAVRRSDYNTVGGVTTYKVDGNWQVVDWLRLRGGYQRAIRAPSLGELYTPPGASNTSIGLPSQGSGDPCDRGNPVLNGPNGAQIRALCARQGIDTATFLDEHTLVSAFSAGNTNLIEETGDSVTAGVVLRSPFDHPLLAGASVTVDYFDLKIKDAIGLITAPIALQSCYNLNGFNPQYDTNNFYCSLIVRDGARKIAGVVTPTQNLATYRTAGWDIALAWRAQLGDLGLPDWGAINVSSSLSIVDKYAIQNLPASPALEYNGTTGTSADVLGVGNLSHPKLRATSSVALDIKAYNAGVPWRYIDSMENASCVGLTTCTVPGTGSINYFDLFGRWKINDRVALRANVNNVFDKGPPRFQGLGATDSATFDVIGRSYLVGLTAKF